MKKLALISLLLLSTTATATASAHDRLDLARCWGQLSYDLLDDNPSPDVRHKIEILHTKIFVLDANTIEQIKESAVVFSKSLEWTNMLDDLTAYKHIKESGQKSCEKVIQ